MTGLARDVSLVPDLLEMLKSFIGSIVHPSTAEIQCFISAVAEETDHNGLYGERRLGGDIHHDLHP